MSDLERVLHLPSLLARKSFFLFGPRATGKSHLIRNQLESDVTLIDLLRSEFYLPLSSNPATLRDIISERSQREDGIVVIDEVQRVPELLNEVHWLIENRRLKFLLTGSSARKLRHGQANLLAGRAWRADLFPLTRNELKQHFDLSSYLRFGGLPAVVLNDAPQEELRAYVGTYLLEEIQAESAVRKMAPFTSFLTIAALCSGQLVNFTKIGTDAGVSPSTVREYFGLLEDTLVGYHLQPWRKSKKRKAVATSKFYFFDIGVAHEIAQTSSVPLNSDVFGRSFEHFIANELRAYLSYRRSHHGLGFWRSLNRQEVDFTIGDEIAIEVKASTKVSARDLKGLKALEEEGVFREFYLVSQDPVDRYVDNRYHMIGWDTFLDRLWGDTIVKPAA